MTSPLDEISFKLGELAAGQAILLTRADKRDAQMERMDTALNDIRASIKPVTEDMAWMKPQVRHYSTHRKRIAWIGSTLFTIGSIIGGGAGNYLMKKYGS